MHRVNSRQSDSDIEQATAYAFRGTHYRVRAAIPLYIAICSFRHDFHQSFTHSGKTSDSLGERPRFRPLLSPPPLVTPDSTFKFSATNAATFNQDILKRIAACREQNPTMNIRKAIPQSYYTRLNDFTDTGSVLKKRNSQEKSARRK